MDPRIREDDKWIPACARTTDERGDDVGQCR